MMTITRELAAGAVGVPENQKEKEMIAAIRAVATAAILAAAGIGLAGPASATPPPDGNYTATITDNGGDGVAHVGDSLNFVLSSCGPDCVHAKNRGFETDLHPQGTEWSGGNSDGVNMWFDENTLAGGLSNNNGTHAKIQMRKV